MVGSRWQVVSGMWPNYLGAMRKAGIRCPHQLVVGGEIVTYIAGGAAGGVAGGAGALSTFYILMNLHYIPHTYTRVLSI